MVYLQLFFSFLKIGLFSYGGGLAMIPLISNEIISHQWISDTEFIKIIGIAEMTPGPIAVNAATFVGYQTGGMLGAFVATLGVSLPPLIVILSVSKFLFSKSESIVMKVMFYGIKPVVVALITGAGIFIIRSTVFVTPLQIGTVVIACVLFFISHKYKMHPILLILFAAGMGWGWTAIEHMLK